MHPQLQSAPIVVIELDAAQTVVGWNDLAEQVFGTSRLAAIGKPLAASLPIAGGADAWRAHLADPAPQRLTVDHPTAGARLLELAVRPAGPGHTLFITDVTARAATERRQALESTIFNAIKDHLDVVLWAVDSDGRFVFNQGKALASIGHQPGENIGRNIFDLYGDLPEAGFIRAAMNGAAQHTPPNSAVEKHGVLWDSWYIPVADTASDAAVVGLSLNLTEVLRAKLDLIERQREVIREMQTPIIEVWDGILALPIIGLVDSVRTAEIMENLLQTVGRTRARSAILDLTGVQVVDTSTASHLIGLIQAIRLLGAEGVLTGIHPNIAQTIVSIGVDLSRVRVFARLADALKYCLTRPEGPKNR
jgi:rsbT co-antagonist protein RsbR